MFNSCSYEYGQSIIDTIFGAKVHADFPRLYRLADDDCTGSGFYPSKLQADGISEYWSHGVDLVVQAGDIVSEFNLIKIVEKCVKINRIWH